jgi:hypothetical protein
VTPIVPIPGEVLEAAGVDPGDVVVLDQRIPNWRVVANGQPAVLKRDWHLNVLDIAWEHGFLRELATTGFPAPHRVDAFAGCSWSVLAQARSGPW